MDKVLIAVDDKKASEAVIFTFRNLVQRPESAVLVHVMRLEGKSLMIDMLGEAELSTLKDSLKGTEHWASLERKARKTLAHYKSKLEKLGDGKVRTVIREGRPAEEILKVADEEGVDLIILGNGGKKGLDRIIAGSIDSEVRKNAQVPVMTARRTVLCEEPYRWKDAYAAFSAFTIVVFGLILLGYIM